MSGIGYVSHIPHPISQVHQVTKNDVEGDEGSGMPQVALTTYGRSTHVHAYAIWDDRLKYLFFPREGVIHFQFGHKREMWAKVKIMM
jgi:hypothetical protein